MYGKKRIVIQKNYQIVLAGSNGNGGNWCPVGWLRPDVGITGTRFANILKDQYGDQDDFETIQAPSKKALKDVINKKYQYGLCRSDYTP